MGDEGDEGHEGQEDLREARKAPCLRRQGHEDCYWAVEGGPGEEQERQDREQEEVPGARRAPGSRPLRRPGRLSASRASPSSRRGRPCTRRRRSSIRSEREGRYTSKLGTVRLVVIHG